MSHPVKPEGSDTPPGVVRGIRWTAEQWQRLEQAAAVLAEREVLNVSAADVIRSGAMRRADEILGAA